MAVKMMHCCFDRTGRRIRSTEREREVASLAMGKRKKEGGRRKEALSGDLIEL